MKVLDIILEASDKPKRIFVFGDSIAVGIKDAGGADGSAKGGENTEQVLARIEDFVSSKGKALQGATVILSSGASNSTFERKSGEKKALDTTPIARQISTLKAAGASNIILVGTGSGESKWIKNKYGEYRVNFKDQQVNEKLASIASSKGAKFLGPLESFDPGMNSEKGDGIHPFGGYKKLYQSAVDLAPAKVSQGSQPADSSGANPNIDDATRDRARAWAAKQNKSDAAGSLQVPSSIWHGADTEAIQQALIDLGYKLPKHGADSFFGPETAQAVRQFQKDNGLKVDGDPGPETIGKLNALAKKTPDAPASKADAPAIAPKSTAPAGPARSKADIPKDASVKKPAQGAMIAPRSEQPANTKGGRNIVDQGDVSAYLKSKRMSGNHRIGILANIAGESGFNSAIINPNDKGKRAIGFFQHRDDRDRNLEKAVPDWRTNWKGQIDFALSEPAGKRYLATKFKTYEQAVEQWVRDFERPEDAWGDTLKRIAIADQLVKNKV